METNIFNFSPTSPVPEAAVEEVKSLAKSPCEKYTSPNSTSKEHSEQLTPQEIEEYYILKQKQAELERRIKEIETKKLLSGKSNHPHT